MVIYQLFDLCFKSEININLFIHIHKRMSFESITELAKIESHHVLRRLLNLISQKGIIGLCSNDATSDDRLLKPCELNMTQL